MLKMLDDRNLNKLLKKLNKYIISGKISDDLIEGYVILLVKDKNININNPEN